MKLSTRKSIKKSIACSLHHTKIEHTNFSTYVDILDIEFIMNYRQLTQADFRWKKSAINPPALISLPIVIW